MGNHHADVLIHIDESLDEDRLRALEKVLGTETGIYSACVSDRARHLMVVEFDPEDRNPTSILERIEAEGVHGELVGL